MRAADVPEPMEPATIATFLVAGAASLFMAWAIGAGSSGSTPFAPAVGANAISVMRAGFFVGILGLLGATLQGANVTEAVGRELVVGEPLGPVAAIVALSIAAALVAIGVFAGYPIATAFTVTGAVVGAGLAMGGGPAWPKYAEILGVWFATPIVGGSIAYAIARLLRSKLVSEHLIVILLGGTIGAILANVEFAFLGPSGEAASVATAMAKTHLERIGITLLGAGVAGGLLAVDLRRNPVSAEKRFLLVLGGLVAFSAGGSQVGLALGPMLPLVDGAGVSVPLVALLFGGGIGLLIGSWTGAPRMIKAVAQDYSSLGPRRSIAALVPSFGIAQVAILLGVPVSFNEIIVSSIIGGGAAAASGGVSGTKIGYTVLAWVGSLVGAGVLGYAGYLLVSTVL